MAIIDISPEISPELAVWPGDVPFQRQVALDMAGGDPLTLSSMTTTLHLGAHVDAPSHYIQAGQTIEARSLHYYYGPCQVIDVRTPRGARILPGDLLAPVEAERVLLRTGSFPEPTRFNEDFCSLSPELVEHLHRRGVCLIGIDTPSVDPFDDTTLESHRAVAGFDMAVLEGVVLTDAPPGLYQLIALPLRLRGSDASPVRAVLVEQSL
jgi:arylformamidase